MKTRIKMIIRKIYGIKTRYWLLLLMAALCIGVLLGRAADSEVIPAGKYLLLNGEIPQGYVVVQEDKILEGAYASPKEHIFTNSDWCEPPFTPQQWEQLANPYDMPSKKPVPVQIEGASYFDLGTVTADQSMETSAGVTVLKNVQTHTFLLRNNQQLYFCKKQSYEDVSAVSAWRMVPQGGQADPVAAGIRELDAMVERMNIPEHIKTSGISPENTVLAHTLMQEDLYKEIYSHPYVIQYIAYKFAEEGVTGGKEIFMEILFEKVLDRKQEPYLTELTGNTATERFTVYMDATQKLYAEKGYSYILGRYPVSAAMLLYLTNIQS